MRILGLAGRRGAGKDTVFWHLRDVLRRRGLRVTRVGMADRIKHIAMQEFNIDPSYAFGNDDDKTRRVTGTPYTIRQVLQQIGDAFCKIDPLHWVRHVAAQIDHNAGADLVVITDIRLPAEIEYFRSRGAKIVLLTRAATRDDPHITETIFDIHLPEAFDAIVDNREESESETTGRVLNLLRNWQWIA